MVTYVHILGAGRERGREGGKRERGLHKKVMLIHNVTGLCILTLHHSLIPLVLRFEGNVDAVDVVSVEVNYSPSAAQAVVFRLIARVYSK